MARELTHAQVSNLSGAAYVAASFEGKLTKLVTSVPKLCDHKSRICTSCAHQWNWDYYLLWERTAGGRKMLSELPEGWENRKEVVSSGRDD